MTQESADCSDGLAAFTFYVLQKKPAQYKAAVQDMGGLLAKVRAKIEKTKAVRVDKKTKVKEKMETGEYLPKDVYEAQRQAKREKLLAERAEREAKKALEKKEKKEKQKEDGDDEEGESHGKKEFKRSDRPIKKEFKKEGADGKTKWNKDRATGKFDKGKKPAWEDKRGANDKVKQFKRDKAQEETPAVKLHPSWEAKKQQVDRDTHIKFVQNEVFEF